MTSVGCCPALPGAEWQSVCWGAVASRGPAKLAALTCTGGTVPGAVKNPGPGGGGRGDGISPENWVRITGRASLLGNGRFKGD